MIMFHRGHIVFDTGCTEHDSLNVGDLFTLFRKAQGEELSDDSLLLG